MECSTGLIVILYPQVEIVVAPLGPFGQCLFRLDFSLLAITKLLQQVYLLANHTLNAPKHAERMLIVWPTPRLCIALVHVVFHVRMKIVEFLRINNKKIIQNLISKNRKFFCIYSTYRSYGAN